MLVVVTAGGVREKIDNVRSITNSSTGKLGHLIVDKFLDSEVDCEVIYIYGGDAQAYLDESDRVENIWVKDTKDLQDSVSEILTSKKVDIFVHSMAVADYTTSYVIDFGRLCELVQNVEIKNLDNYIEECRLLSNSKISSDIEEPAVILRKTPKIIEQVKKLSPYTFLVGFKLLDKVSEEELFDVGFNLLRKNRCNLVLANDISLIRQGNHRGLLIYPEKTYDVVEGKENIAELIVEKSIERNSVKHPKSVQISDKPYIPEAMYKDFRDMGKWLDKEDFLPKVINHDRPDKIGTYGNMSCKNNKGFYITCRNVNKADLKETDLSWIENVLFDENDSVYSQVNYHSVLKPSIDSTIHSEIYRYSDYSCIVHIHTNKVFLGYPLVEDCYPCGCDLECKSILSIIKKNPSIDIIQLRKHGLIVLGNNFNVCASKISELFDTVPYIDYDTNEISLDCHKHTIEVSPTFVDVKSFNPLKIKGEHIGCIYENIEKDKIHFGIYTMENIRGKGLNIVKKYLSLYNKDYVLHTTDLCDIADFYKSKYGFVDYNLEDIKDLQYILYKI